MSEKQETVADIVTEMRSLLKPGETLNHTYELLNGLADRIEAAQKMEVGNGAKMREALKQILALAKAKGLFEIQSLSETALAEPPRNCDVGTAMEQGERFSAYCRAHKHPESECLHCPLFGQTGGYCELAWAQMPYKEGGAK